jgi:hypothetical protein
MMTILMQPKQASRDPKVDTFQIYLVLYLSCMLIQHGHSYGQYCPPAIILPFAPQLSRIRSFFIPIVRSIGCMNLYLGIHFMNFILSAVQFHYLQCREYPRTSLHNPAVKVLRSSHIAMEKSEESVSARNGKELHS